MGKDAVIICAGAFPRKAYPRYLMEKADVVICCDSAAREWLKHFPSRLPDAVIGDMDSLPRALRKDYADLIIKMDDQESIDLTKAFNYLLEHHGADLSAVHIIGADGKRPDHSIANLSLLMEYTVQAPGMRIEAVGDYGTAFAITDSCTISCGKGRAVSIFTPDSKLRIKSKGLEWPTDAVVFDNWWKGSLNRCSEDNFTLTLSHPSKVLIITD